LRVVVVAGGSEGMLPGREDLLGADYLIAADGGADIVHAAGGTPDLVVGDMDSISSRGRRALKQDGVEVRVFPCAKDETDLEIALRAAVSVGAGEVTVFCSLGGPRLDHLLGAVSLLAADWLHAVRVKLVDFRHAVYMASGDASVVGEPGDLVSLLPQTRQVEDVTTQGLLYPLSGETLYRAATRGVSNELTGTRARVSHGPGDLLIVQHRMG